MNWITKPNSLSLYLQNWNEIFVHPKSRNASPLMHNFGTTSVVVLPAAVVLTIAPAEKHVVLVIVSIDVPRGVVVIVEIVRPVGTGGVAPLGCAKSSISTLLKLEGGSIVLLPPENDEDPPNALVGNEPEVAIVLVLVLAAVTLEVRRARPVD